MSWTVRMLLTISLIALPVYVYVGMRTAGAIGLVFPGTLVKARVIGILLLAWLCLFPILTALSVSSGFLQSVLVSDTRPPITDFLLYYPVWVGLIIVLEIIPPFLVLELGALVTRLFPSLFRWGGVVLAWCRIVLFAAATVYVIVRVVLDTSWVRDDVVHLHPSRMPPELSGLTLTLLADVQVDRFTGDAKLGQVKTIVDDRQPDILFSAGDLVTSGTAYLDDARAFVGILPASTARIAVMGDHDMWSAPKAIAALYKRSGWIFLDNEHRLIPYRGRQVLISGLTHVYSDRMAPSDLEAFFSAAPAADFKILVVHQPAELVVALARKYQYDLMLAGHTHGGQIVFHPLGFTFAASMRETRFYSGVYHEGELTIVVTRGVGLTLAPVRYSAPAEVTTIVLQ